MRKRAEGNDHGKERAFVVLLLLLGTLIAIGTLFFQGPHDALQPGTTHAVYREARGSAR